MFLLEQVGSNFYRLEADQTLVIHEGCNGKPGTVNSTRSIPEEFLIKMTAPCSFPNPALTIVAGVAAGGGRPAQNA